MDQEIKELIKQVKVMIDRIDELLEQFNFSNTLPDSLSTIGNVIDFIVTPEGEKEWDGRKRKEFINEKK